MTEREKADMWFARLVPLLAVQKLPCENGPARIGSPDEFMFMCESNGIGSFKHRDTRNHVYVRRPQMIGGFEPATKDWELYIPVTTVAFNKGFFDTFDIPA